MLRRTSLVFGLGLGLVIGCGGYGSGEGPAGSAEQPIINGTKDTTHDAVVAVLGNQSACTGTIISKNVAAKKGYVLTAAHCVEDPPQVIVRGQNYASGTQYPVVDYLAHQNYDGQVYDFAMVTFTWSQTEPPAIPAMTSAQDDLMAGSSVKFLGYGVTESNQNNSTRYYFDGELQQVQALTVSYNQSTGGPFANDGGPCFGDSGGPALFNVPGTGEVVAAITSYGDQNCTEFGVSGRVSAIGTWINNYITNGGGGTGGQTCDQCAQEATSAGGSCIGAVNTCLNNADCSDFVQCFNACQTQACADQCVQDFPNGVDGYVAILNCLCDSGCPTECASADFCQGGSGPQCGFSAEDPACLTCFEGECCAQGSACADDPGCTDCITGANSDPNCINENVFAAQFYQCLVQKCSTECGIMGGGGSGGGGIGGSTGQGGAGQGGAGQGGGGVGAGVPQGGAGQGGGGVGNEGQGASAGDGGDGGDGGGAGGNGDNSSAVNCACRTGAGSSDGGNTAIVLGAALMGLFASRRRRLTK